MEFLLSGRLKSFKMDFFFAALMFMAFAILAGPHSVVAAAIAPYLSQFGDPQSLGMGVGLLGAIMMGDVSPFPTIPELLAVKMAYRNQDLIADSVLPRFRVNKLEYRYTYFDKGDLLTIQNTAVGRTSSPNRVELRGHQATGTCLPYGLDFPVPQQDIDESAGTGYDPLAVATMALASWIALDREVRAAALAFNAANYGANNKTQLSGNDQWDKFSQAAADPVEDITTAIDACLVRPNYMAIGRAAFTKLMRNPNIIKSVSNITGVGIASRRAIADLFELKDIFVGESFVNTAKKGQTAVLSRTWGKHCLLFYQNSSLTNLQFDVTFGWTAQKEQYAGAKPDGNIGLAGGTIVRAGEYVEEKITAPDCAYFIQDCVG